MEKEKNTIGFLEDFRRLNVSITRAIYGMVVIGNAKCLYHDKSIWRNFINYYQKNHLIYSPKVNKEKDEEIVYDIDNLTEIEIGHDKDINIDEDEFVFGKEEDYQDINQDLIDNYESTSNIYAEGNKNDINKKEENKNIKGVDEKDKINENKKLENKEQNNNKDSNNESQKKENNNRETNSNKIGTNNLNKKGRRR